MKQGVTPPVSGWLQKIGCRRNAVRKVKKGGQSLLQQDLEVRHLLQAVVSAVACFVLQFPLLVANR